MSKATCTTFRFVQHLHFLPFGMFVTGYNHLRNALPIFYHKILR